MRNIAELGLNPDLWGFGRIVFEREERAAAPDH
jgi:hypothetical protein